MERYKHPYYETVGKGKDIMLLKLAKKARLDNRVQTIPLPRPETKKQTNKENQRCRVAGWGSIKTNGSIVDDLRVVDVSIINLQVCQGIWSGLPLPDSVICAGGYGTNKGFCQGDSGGPLVCDGKAVGVVSFNNNKNCNYPNVPNIYTETSKYLDWIKSIIKPYE
ncbi:chymotrypsin-like elastase family member 2A [Epinephelus lanceolatus]